MALYAIGDLHLCLGANKPMDIFGGNWVGYMDKLTEGARMRNPDIEIMPLSAKTGEGVQALAQRIIRAVKS